jgi:methionyl-tRNA formyltransferase
LLNREKESAVTVHYMNESIDDGEIIQQDTFDISGLTSLHEVYMKLLEIAPRTVMASLISIEKGKVSMTENLRSNTSYFSFPRKGDGKRFRSLGLKFV